MTIFQSNLPQINSVMLLQYQVETFLNEQYRSSILSQIPPSYSPTSALLTLTLNIDLLKVFQKNKDIGVLIVSKYPIFYTQASKAIQNILKTNDIGVPEFGIHLLIKISNCPLPSQNISSPEFLAASFEQREGIMVYFPSVTVMQVGQPEIYLFNCIQNWVPKCSCIDNKDRQIRHKINRNLIEVVKNSQVYQCVNKKNRLEMLQSQAPVCQLCERAYKFQQFSDEIYMNCHKIKILIPKNLSSLQQSKISIFASHQLTLYTESKLTTQLKIGDQISCCCYLFCKSIPIKNVVPIGAQLLAKPSMKSILISSYKYDEKNHYSRSLLQRRSEVNKFIGELLKISHLNLRTCSKLSDYEAVLQNYNNLINQVNLIQFPYLPQNTLSIFKLTILNSIFNLFFLGTNLSIMIIVQQREIITRAIMLQDLPLKFWPSDYDEATLRVWLVGAKGSIIVVSNPTKKDLKIIESFLSKEQENISNSYCLTFWIISENSLKKEINHNYFGIVLDLTSEKNMNVCKTVIDETIDARLGAFLTEEEVDLVYTIPKMKNRNARITLAETYKKESKYKQLSINTDEIEVAKQILQKYYLKCRELKKTTKASFTYLLKLAEGFSVLNNFFAHKNTQFTHQPSISIIDAVLAIFLDEESSRHKYSNANTIFGTDVSKIVLNEKDCEISFWDFECSEEGTLHQIKNYMPKDEMMKKMLYRLNELIYEDQLLIDDY